LTCSHSQGQPDSLQLHLQHFGPQKAILCSCHRTRFLGSKSKFHRNADSAEIRKAS